MANNQISVKNGQMVVNAGHQLSTNCVTACNGNSHATVVATGPFDCSQFSGNYSMSSNFSLTPGGPIAGWTWGFSGAPQATGGLWLINCPDAWYAMLDNSNETMGFGGSVTSCSSAFGANAFVYTHMFKLPSGSVSCSTGRPLGSFTLPGLSTPFHPCVGGFATVTLT